MQHNSPHQLNSRHQQQPLSSQPNQISSSPLDQQTRQNYGLWPLPLDMIDTVVKHSFSHSETATKSQHSTSDATTREAIFEPRQSAGNAAIPSPWNSPDLSNEWRFDFQSHQTDRQQEGDSVAVSPKTQTFTTVTHPGYWLPGFLKEEVGDLSAEPSLDDGEVGRDTDDEATPMQESLVQYQYHDGGNFFLPVHARGLETVDREKLKGNTRPPETPTPVVERFGDASALDGFAYELTMPFYCSSAIKR